MFTQGFYGLGIWCSQMVAGAGVISKTSYTCLEPGLEEPNRWG